MRPLMKGIRCGLNTHARGIQKAAKRVGRSPGLENLAMPRAFTILITVARPRGSLTRFPILPATSGAPKRFEVQRTVVI